MARRLLGRTRRSVWLGLALWVATWWPGIPQVSWATETVDVYVSVYGVGGFFEDRKVSVMSLEGISTNIRSGVGAGLRVGIFPEFTGRALGLEIEYFGTFQRMSFVFPGNGGVVQGSAGLAVMNSMANLVIRWPNGRVRPYGGFGGGYSSGLLHNPTILGRNTGDWDSTAAFAYQFFAGVQGDVSDRLFVFAEYKRLAADYHWNGFALDVRANFMAVGLGIKF